MNLYLISQHANSNYDTYDSAVVVASDEATARTMNPANGKPMTEEGWAETYSTWCASLDQVHVTYLGEANESFDYEGVICSSFNAS